MAEDGNNNPPQDPPPTTPAPAAAPAPGPDVTAQLAQAQETIKATTNAFRAQVRTVNPDLPETAFAGDDVASIQKGIESARAVIDHAAKYAADHPATAAAPASPPGAGVTRQPAPMPGNVHGSGRIGAALARGDSVTTATGGEPKE